MHCVCYTVLQSNANTYVQSNSDTVYSMYHHSVLQDILFQLLSEHYLLKPLHVYTYPLTFHRPMWVAVLHPIYRDVI